MTPTPDNILAAADVLRQIITPLVERLDAFGTRLEALEEREYCGVWAPGQTYRKFSTATFEGHSWVARETTSEQPGNGSTAWTLQVRRGKQGREGKQGPPCRCVERERVTP